MEGRPSSREDLVPIHIHVAKECFQGIENELYPLERIANQDLLDQGIQNLVFQTFSGREFVLRYD